MQAIGLTGKAAGDAGKAANALSEKLKKLNKDYKVTAKKTKEGTKKNKEYAMTLKNIAKLAKSGASSARKTLASMTGQMSSFLQMQPLLLKEASLMAIKYAKGVLLGTEYEQKRVIALKKAGHLSDFEYKTALKFNALQSKVTVARINLNQKNKQAILLVQKRKTLTEGEYKAFQLQIKNLQSRQAYGQQEYILKQNLLNASSQLASIEERIKKTTGEKKDQLLVQAFLLRKQIKNANILKASTKQRFITEQNFMKDQILLTKELDRITEKNNKNKMKSGIKEQLKGLSLLNLEIKKLTH